MSTFIFGLLVNSSINMSLKLAPGAGETAQWVSARCADRRPDLQSVTPVNVGGRDPAAQHWEVEEQAGPGTCWAAILAKQPAPGPRSKPVSGHKAESHSRRETASSGLCMHTPQTHLSSNVMFYVTFILPQSNKILKKKKSHHYYLIFKSSSPPPSRQGLILEPKLAGTYYAAQAGFQLE